MQRDPSARYDRDIETGHWDAIPRRYNGVDSRGAQVRVAPELRLSPFAFVHR
jgi:hypothetical protein